MKNWICQTSFNPQFTVNCNDIQWWRKPHASVTYCIESSVISLQLQLLLHVHCFVQLRNGFRKTMSPATHPEYKNKNKHKNLNVLFCCINNKLQYNFYLFVCLSDAVKPLLNVKHLMTIIEIERKEIFILNCICSNTCKGNNRTLISLKRLFDYAYVNLLLCA